MIALNPTTLTVGKTGQLDGRRATVVGRAVLESADRYRWYEYYVQLDGGRMVILVYEAGAWKQFDELATPPQLTAAKAATYRAGQFLDLPGRHAQVKYVSTSRVRYTEGRTWDGVRVGSVARYFNAEGDDGLLVVSWTGDEIELYTGRPVSRFLVSGAFGVAEPPFWKRLLCGGSGSLAGDESPPTVYYVFGALLLVIAVALLMFGGSARPVDPPPVAPPPAVELQPGKHGFIGDDRIVIVGAAQVEIDAPGTRFRRYEYDLVDGRGDRALLVEDLDGDPHQWELFRPVPAPRDLVPTKAAALRVGAPLVVSGAVTTVQQLFLSRTLQTADAATAPSATVSHGFLARAGDTWTMARWTEVALDLEQGQAVPESTILRAFGVAPTGNGK